MNRSTFRWVVVAVASVLLGSGCGGSDDASNPTSTSGAATTATTVATTTAAPSTTSTTTAPGPTKEEFRFSSGGFDLVGDLHLPGGSEPHGAVILVHGSGPQTRNSTPTLDLVRRRFLDAGFAALSWDKPGSGSSTGELSSEFQLTERAEIVAAAVTVLRNDARIDPDRIGLWGLSQAGWVMPKVLTMADDVAFMIVVSGGGEDSIEQMAYRWTRQAECRGATPDELSIMEQYGAAALKAEDYEQHRTAMEQLLTIPDLSSYLGIDVELQEASEWSPWPRDIDSFFDPITIIEQTTIPVFAVFGENDLQVDGGQAAAAYEAALQRAGNQMYRVELLPEVGHTMQPAPGDGCQASGGGYSARYVELIEEWVSLIAAS